MGRSESAIPRQAIPSGSLIAPTLLYVHLWSLDRFFQYCQSFSIHLRGSKLTALGASWRLVKEPFLMNKLIQVNDLEGSRLQAIETVKRQLIEKKPFRAERYGHATL
jgi:hypothetical protein